MARDNQSELITRLFRDHRDLAEREFRRVLRELESLRKEVRILREVMTDGAQMTFPWFDLPTPKLRQVERVRECLKAHPSYTIKQACDLCYEVVPGGYTSVSGLVSYCYRNKVDKYAD